MDALFITLDEAKLQCRIAPEDTSEDQLLSLYCKAAEQTVLSLINSSYCRIMDDYTELPEPLKVAMLMSVAHMYKYRELSTQDAVNRVPGLFAMIAPYKILSE